VAVNLNHNHTNTHKHTQKHTNTHKYTQTHAHARTHKHTRTQVKEAKETEIAINFNRNQYRNVAARGAMLFFLLNSLNKIHAFYQYSLNAFVSVFSRGLDLAPGGRKKPQQVCVCAFFLSFPFKVAFLGSSGHMHTHTHTHTQEARSDTHTHTHTHIHTHTICNCRRRTPQL